MVSSNANFSGIDDAEQVFARMVNSQLNRVTQELLKLEQLLKAGMVDGNALREFRKAVDQVRQTSWAVQQNLQEKQERQAETRG